MIVVVKGDSAFLTKSTNNFPIILGESWRADCFSANLDSTFGVNVGSGLLSVSGAWEDEIGEVSALVSMSTLVNDKGVLRNILSADIISSKNVDKLRLETGSNTGGETNIKSSNSGTLMMDDVKSVPGLLVRLDRRMSSDLVAGSEDSISISSLKSPGPQHHHREFSIGESSTERMSSFSNFYKRRSIVSKVDIAVGGLEKIEIANLQASKTYSYPRSTGAPITATLSPLYLVAFKILALRTGDSVLGLTPTNRRRSENSTPLIVEFII